MLTVLVRIVIEKRLRVLLVMIVISTMTIILGIIVMLLILGKMTIPSCVNNPAVLLCVKRCQEMFDDRHCKMKDDPRNNALVAEWPFQPQSSAERTCMCTVFLMGKGVPT